jgi:hypothetical protein
VVKNMGFFDLKATCINCEKEIGLNRYKTAEGWICTSCMKLSGYSLTTPIRTKTISDIKNDIAKMNDRKEELSNFNTTKKIGTYIEFDEEQRLWLIPDGFMGKKKNPRIYSFDDIVEYELLEDGDTITKGGLGRAVAGGVLFGGVGAIVGGVTGGKKSKSIINSLKIKITICDFQNPTVYINLINTKTKADSFVYKTNYNAAQQILSVFALIQKQNENQQAESTSDEPKNSGVSAADEILKFKALLDGRIITQDEFDAKKKQLLNL